MGQIKYVSKLPQFIEEKAARDGVTYRQEDVAEFTGLTRQAVNRWFQKRPFTYISVHMLERLSQWLDVEWYQLIERHTNGNHN